MITHTQSFLKILLNIKNEGEEMSLVLRLITDIVLVMSLYILTLFAIFVTTYETFKTHVKFQNQRKNLPDDVKERLDSDNAMVVYFDEEEATDEDHWGEYVSIFHCFGPRMLKKLVRRKHKDKWTKNDIKIFHRFYVLRYFMVFVYGTTLIQILKVMEMRAIYQKLPEYVAYMVGISAFLNSKVNLCYYIREDVVFDWYVQRGGGSYGYSMICFIIFQELLSLAFKWTVYKIIG